MQRLATAFDMHVTSKAQSPQGVGHLTQTNENVRYHIFNLLARQPHLCMQMKASERVTLEAL